MADPKFEPAESKGPGDMRINGSFGSRTVAKGVKVQYSLEGYNLTRDRVSNMDGPNVRIQWVVTYHYGRDDAQEPERWQKKKDDSGRPSTLPDFVFEWDKVGHHRVHCLTWDFDGKPFAKMEVDQRVAEMWAILESEWEQRKSQKLPDPVTELKTVRKYRDLLVAMGKQQASAMSRDAKQQHEKRVAELTRYADKLADLLAKCDENQLVPFKAVYLAKDSMEFADLRVFLTFAKGSSNELMVVDWTNVEEPKLHGTYSGKIPPFEPYDGAGAGSHAPPPTPTADDAGKRWQKGVANAVHTWADDNHYWPGGVEYELYAKKSGYSIQMKATFKTGDPSAAETLAAWLKKIAMGAAVIALVLTGIGSAYAGALIVTSMVAGTTGAVLSIHHRHATGEDNFLADAMDVLDIAANVFGVGYRAGAAVVWKAGKTVTIEATGSKVLKALFIGQTWANGFNGVLLGVSFIDRYNQIMAATGITPDERAQRLLDVFKDAGQVGALHVVNQKVATAVEKANFERLLEQEAAPTHVDAGSGGKKPTPPTGGAPPPPSGGKPPPPGGGKPGKPDGVPTHIDDQESGFHKVPSDSNKPGQIHATDKPGFKGNTKDGEKKVTVVNKQEKHPAAGVPPRTGGDDEGGGSKISLEWPPKDDKIWKTHEISDTDIKLYTHDGYYFSAEIHGGYLDIVVNTRMNDKHSPYLGTGRENYARMFHHFESHGQKIKGWQGLLVKDNYKPVKDALNAGKAPKDALFESVSWKKFIKPWADSKGYKAVVEEAEDGAGYFSFSVKFEPK